ncbi:MAG: GNAT family N-acetyltransferase [Clostridiales bacterium]|nr:GNAT family N-acetyltransferase [Clostridiales bacterium]
MPYSSEIAVLKKFFVYEKYQGKPYHIGRKLYDELLSFARKEAYKTILLDTPHNTERAHKFYEGQFVPLLRTMTGREKY